MTRQAALLRAVNVGGATAVAMADVRATIADLGFEAETLLQTGNLVFEAAKPKAAKLEALLEAAFAERLDLKTDVMVRTPADWQALMQANPFAAVARERPSQMVVVFLKEAPGAAALAALRRAYAGPEPFELEGRQLYVDFVAGQGRSKLTPALIERHLQVRGTARNWNTVSKIGELLLKS